MRDFIDRYQIPIGLVLIAAILAGSAMLWAKDQKIKKDNLPSAETQKLDQLEAENTNLKAQLAGSTNSGVQANNSADSPKTSADQNAGKIDLNTADAAALDSLPGIGPVYAQRIIDYRIQNGKFSSIDEVTKVKGIGPKTFEKFKDKITVN